MEHLRDELAGIIKKSVRFDFARNRPDEIDDLTGETMLKAYRVREKWGEIENSIGWLVTIAKNTHMQQIRNRYLQKHSAELQTPYDIKDWEFRDEGKDDPEPCLLRREKIAAVREAISRLKPHEQEILLLTYYEGMEDWEISERLGVNRHTVRTRLRRGRIHFKEIYEKVYHNTDRWEREGNYC